MPTQDIQNKRVFDSLLLLTVLSVCLLALAASSKPNEYQAYSHFATELSHRETAVLQKKGFRESILRSRTGAFMMWPKANDDGLPLTPEEIDDQVRMT